MLKKKASYKRPFNLIIYNMSYKVNIFYWNSLNDIIITTNEILLNT
jgi:hypothetical protein